MSEELKQAAQQALEACPFCGADPQDAHHIEYGRWAVTCRCGASGAFANTGPNATDAAKIKAYSDARTAWNTRALTAAQPAQATPEPAGEPATVPRDAWDELERERDWWRTRARTAMQHHEGEVWYWMGDGEDHLESLVNNLPVVIRADQLRKMLTRPAPGVPEVDMDDLPGHLAEISIAVCDGDNLAAQSGLRDAIRLLAAQAKGGGHV